MREHHDDSDGPTRENFKVAAAAEEREGARSLLAFMGNIAGGELETEGSKELHELAKTLDVEARFRNAMVKGSLTIKINVATDECGMSDVTYKIEKKTPIRKTSRSTFWMTKGGNFTPRNPKQTELPLRDVNAASKPRATETDNRPPREA